MATIHSPSFRSLFIQMHFNDYVISCATAFVVDTPTKGPHLVTNRHNVTGRDHNTGELLSKDAALPNHIAVWHNEKGRLGHWVRRIEPLFVNEEPRWIEHPQMGVLADFVALPLTELKDVALYPYDPVNPGAQIRVGPSDAVSVIGFPFGRSAGGLFGVWANGFIASEPAVDFNHLPTLLVDCRTRKGQSGSPVIAYRFGGTVPMENGNVRLNTGELERFLGVYSGRINERSDLGIVWKASALAELIQTL